MEKKSLPDETRDVIHIYTPAMFDAGSQYKPFDAEKLKQEQAEAAARAEREGYEKGHASGYEKGMKDGEKEIGQRILRCERIIGELENFKTKKIVELSPQIIELSLEIAGKIVHKEIELDKNVIRYVVEDAIKRLGEREDSVIIKVNPIDYEIMIANMDMFKEQSGVKNITVEPLSSISPGGCYIETLTSEIDSRVEEQFKEVSNAISTAIDS